MTPAELAAALQLKILNLPETVGSPVSGVFCCDLLSIVISKAKSNAAWITVMSNLNTIAVAVLSDISCVIISEGTPVDDEIVARAKEQGVFLFQTNQPTFETGLAIDRLLS